MSDFFSQAMNDLDGLEEEILGPDYPYYKYIKSPHSMGMSDDGNKIATNIGALISYGEILSAGGGKASTAGILGDKYFMTTAAKCKDIDSGETVTRSIYINNVPDGTIPFVSSMSGESYKSFRGLVPGVLSDMAGMNPLTIFQAFMIGANPDCQSLTMETIDGDNVTMDKTAYVITADIQNIPPCSFKDNRNPITNMKCKEVFSNMNPDKLAPDSNNDPAIRLYYGTIGLLGFYILIKLLYKQR
jgi:hypothetical protein